MLTETQLRQILPLLPLARLQVCLPHLNEAMRVFRINTLLRTAAFVAQTAHESAQYTRMLESLYYTRASGLMAMWKRRFPTEASALPYLRNEPMLGNYVYANRMGNGNAASGEGFRYRGRGVIQLTGRDAYQRAAAALGLDLVGKPELVQSPEVAFPVAGLYWLSNGLNELADRGDFTAITQRINGGQTGQADRLKYFETARRVLAAGFNADAPTVHRTRGAVVLAAPIDIGPWNRGWQDSADFDLLIEAEPAPVKAAPAPRKAVAKKAAAKKIAAPEGGAKASVKAPPAKKTAARKVPARPAAVSKRTAKPVPAKKAASKKAAPKKVVAKKAVAKKAASVPPRAR